MFFEEEFELITISEIQSESFIPGERWKGHSNQTIHVRVPLQIYKQLILVEYKIELEVRGNKRTQNQNKIKRS